LENITTKVREHFEGIPYEIDGHVFVSCTFRDVELRALGTAPFAFTGCTFPGATRFDVSPQAYALLLSLACGRDVAPIRGFLRDLLIKSDRLPTASIQ
jgi:hypothetical protein